VPALLAETAVQVEAFRGIDPAAVLGGAVAMDVDIREDVTV
jgi:hypothetical protein